MNKKTRQAGFTLIELMVVVALVAIFAMVGIPSYESLTTTNRMATEINGLLASLQYARSEAIMRGVNVSICASSDQSTCNNPSNGWNAGWIVTAPGTSPSLLRVHGKIGSNDRFSTNPLALNTVIFNRNGFSTSAGTLILDDHAADVSRRQCLVLSMVGHITHDSGNHC